MFTQAEIEVLEESRDFFADGDVSINRVVINCFEIFHHYIMDQSYLENFTISELESFEEQLILYEDCLRNLILGVTLSEETELLLFKLKDILDKAKEHK